MLGLTVSRRLPLRSMHLACFVCGVCTAAADDGDTAANIVIISSVIIHTFPIIWCLDVVKLYNLQFTQTESPKCTFAAVDAVGSP